MSHHHEGCCKHEGQPRHEGCCKCSKSEHEHCGNTVTSMNTVNAAVVATVAAAVVGNVSLVTVNCVW